MFFACVVDRNKTQWSNHGNKWDSLCGHCYSAVCHLWRLADLAFWRCISYNTLYMSCLSARPWSYISSNGAADNEEMCGIKWGTPPLPFLRLAFFVFDRVSNWQLTTRRPQRPLILSFSSCFKTLCHCSCYVCPMSNSGVNINNGLARIWLQASVVLSIMPAFVYRD
jgi:hypothetical protein